MVLTPSNMLPLGTQAPSFDLYDVNQDRVYSLEMLASEKATVILFICNHCPYVKHILDGVKTLAEEYMPKGVSFIAINSNDVKKYPEDSVEKMKELNLPFPYLFDESQKVAKAYDAACTPDFYLFDRELKLVYRGQFDPSRPGSQVPVTGESLRHALNLVLEDKQVVMDQKPSMGCNIKWKEE